MLKYLFSNSSYCFGVLRTNEIKYTIFVLGPVRQFMYTLFWKHEARDPSLLYYVYC